LVRSRRAISSLAHRVRCFDLHWLALRPHFRSWPFSDPAQCPLFGPLSGANRTLSTPHTASSIYTPSAAGAYSAAGRTAGGWPCAPGGVE
jgi:hypothetical protein